MGDGECALSEVWLWSRSRRQTPPVAGVGGRMLQNGTCLPLLVDSGYFLSSFSALHKCLAADLTRLRIPRRS